MPVRDTSLMSYSDLSETIGERQLEVYNAIKSIGHPASDYEIARFMGRRDPNYVRPRRFELVKMGMVFEYGKRKCEITKRTVYVWSLK